jgi:hypothetical protein
MLQNSKLYLKDLQGRILRNSGKNFKVEYFGTLNYRSCKLELQSAHRKQLVHTKNINLSNASIPITKEFQKWKLEANCTTIMIHKIWILNFIGILISFKNLVLHTKYMESIYLNIQKRFRVCGWEVGGRGCGEFSGCNIAVTAGIILFTTPYSTVHRVWLYNKLHLPSANSAASRSGNSKNVKTT